MALSLALLNLSVNYKSHKNIWFNFNQKKKKRCNKNKSS